VILYHPIKPRLDGEIFFPDKALATLPEQTPTQFGGGQNVENIPSRR
jgi:hypothetical protein